MVTEQRVVLKNKIQTGMKDKKTILGKYMNEPYPPLEKNTKTNTPKLVTELPEYTAFEEFKGRKSARFRIVDADGKSYGCSYAHLLDWVFSPPTLLTITTATRIFTFKGKRLERIEQLLMEDKIKELFVYDNGRFKPPSGNKPFIEELTITEQA
jgi:hypothetical protein